MKKIVILIAVVFLSCYAAFSQDTIYIYRAGLVITKRAVAEIDSVTFYKNYSIPQKETVSDVDGNVYHTVTIGSQTWMVENLKTTKYRNGDAIGTTSSLNLDLTYATSPKYQWSYNGIESNVPSYGRLYTWFTATDPRNIAPVGWHVATDAEWATLQSYMIANGYNYDKTTVDNKIAKALSSPLFWNSTTLVGTPGNDPASNNSSGLSLIPNGYRGFDGMYYNIGNSTLMWTGTEYSSTLAYSRGHGYNVVDFGGYNSNKNYGFAVRCVKDVKALATVSTIAPSSITDTTAVAGGKVSTDGFSAITVRGICWSTSVNPTISENKTIDSLGVGSFTSILKGLIPNTTYYVRAYATNSLGTAYGNEISFATQPKTKPSFTDIDGNVYHSVTIGTQTWMLENLKTTKYRNGDAIGTTSSLYMDLTNAITPKYQWAYNGSESNVAINGRLYTWHTVMDSRCIAPVGWHVASDAEWTALQNYLIASGYNYDKTLVDNKIAKSLCSNTGWNNSSINAGAVGNMISQNNLSGLTIYPSGYRGFDGYFYLLGDGCDIWTTTEASATTATIRFMGYQSSSLNPTNSNKNYGFSVRCIKDSAPLVTTLTPTSVADTIAISGGNITSNGGLPIIARGVCWSTSTSPTITSSKTLDSIGSGSFTSKLKGLLPNTTYYIRAYATNSIGTAYGNEQSFKTYSKGSQIVTDIDGNVYHSVTIGTQTWLVENLRAVRFRNGDSIPTTKDNTTWAAYKSTAYSWYNNDITNKSTFGALYNWYAASDTRNIAPVGWHVATDADFTTLTNYLGNESIAGSKMKETGTVNWLSPNSGATNEFGFNGLPGGLRSYDGTFRNKGSNGYFWTSTESDYDIYKGWDRELFYNQINCFRYNLDSKLYGFSIRCVKDIIINIPTITTATATNIIDTTAISGGNITSNGGAPIIARGVCWSTSSNPTISGSKTMDSTGLGSFTSKLKGLLPNTTYFVRAYATNSAGTSYGNEQSFKTYSKGSQIVTDIDGNVYHTVIIGDQTWMIENLRTTKLLNGLSVPRIQDAGIWSSQSAYAYCWYGNDSIANKNTFGALYNWNAVSTRKLAPSGWHIPSKEEINTLTSYLGGSLTAGSKLKESGNTHWSSVNTDATNSTGFTALPGGYRSGTTGDYHYMGTLGVFWSSSDSIGNGGRNILSNTSAEMNYSVDNKMNGFSVRCIKDVVLPVLTTKSATAITDTTSVSGGTISSNGGAPIIARGVCWDTSANPTISSNKTSDSTGLGSFTSKLKGLIPNTTYYVRAYATNSLGTAYGNEVLIKTLSTTISDIDGNIYHTVVIGTQTWMVENLKTTRYNNGDSIGITFPAAKDINIETAPKYQWAYAGNESNVATYGRLYSWYAATDSRKIAPKGWHVATDMEWTTVENFIKNSGNTAKALCANNTWGSSAVVGSIGNDLLKNNALGFNGLPSGYRNTSYFAYIKDDSWGGTALWWSASDDSLTNNAWFRFIDYGGTTLGKNGLSKSCGMAIRCIKD